MDHVWTVDGGRLAGRCGPQKSPWNLASLKREGFTAVVSLECHDPGIEAVQKAGLRHLKICIQDFNAPTEEQIRQFHAFVDKEFAVGGKVLVHCYAGRGRTGTMISAHLIRQGRTVEQAVEEVRARILETDGTLEGAIEAEQMEALHQFARTLAQH